MKSLRTKLVFWYLGSLIVLSVFFYAFVHVWTLPNSTEYFLFLLLVLSLGGLFVIYRVNSLMDQLKSSLEREQQFIADVAHELKTPLTTLRTSLELAKEKERNNEVATSAILEVDRLTGTLKDVLELAWTNSPANTPNFSLINLSLLCEEIVEITSKLAVPKKIDVKSLIDKNIIVKGSKEKLAGAILNIADNAVKYTNPGGKVEISLERVKNNALLVVKDNGVGIEKGEISRVFDRFYRGSKTTGVFGSGLGLAIAKSIIELHGGSIKVKSQSGKGTTFAIVLQLYEDGRKRSFL